MNIIFYKKLALGSYIMRWEEESVRSYFSSLLSLLDLNSKLKFKKPKEVSVERLRQEYHHLESIIRKACDVDEKSKVGKCSNAIEGRIRLVNEYSIYTSSGNYNNQNRDEKIKDIKEMMKLKINFKI
ncbi:hypothetical protein Glove_58g69 [Diversispora epigaea]|uniref:Uncharacterized protein n=1 Tax=Diversispora epigaea TaxID=1348612 RepID=A0A397JFM2_9GLOM|nr:hypothetical protein Glove_58g69 [Diversispora epigaea]